MKSVFTIVTNSHVNQGLSALSSLRSNLDDKNRRYIVYTIDNKPYAVSHVDNIDIVYIPSLDLPDYEMLIDRYLYRKLTPYELRQNVSVLDTIRWALKPCLMQYLLDQYSECIYIDSDLYFINNMTSIVEDIDNIGLSPHFRPYGTSEIFDWMKSLDVIGDTNVFTDGYFNGGFIVSKNTEISKNAISWWKKCCLSRCEINKEIGLYVDQKYLDFMYMYFEGISKINDPGCNIAEWNIFSYHIKDLNLENRTFVINDSYIPKFFHFSGSHFKYSVIMKSFYDDFCKLINHYNSLITN